MFPTSSLVRLEILSGISPCASKLTLLFTLAMPFRDGFRVKLIKSIIINDPKITSKRICKRVLFSSVVASSKFTEIPKTAFAESNFL